MPQYSANASEVSVDLKADSKTSSTHLILNALFFISGTIKALSFFSPFPVKVLLLPQVLTLARSTSTVDHMKSTNVQKTFKRWVFVLESPRVMVQHQQKGGIFKMGERIG